MGILERFKLDGRVALVTAGSGPQFGSSLTEGLAEAYEAAKEFPHLRSRRHGDLGVAVAGEKRGVRSGTS